MSYAMTWFAIKLPCGGYLQKITEDDYRAVPTAAEATRLWARSVANIQARALGVRNFEVVTMPKDLTPAAEDVL